MKWRIFDEAVEEDEDYTLERRVGVSSDDS
jgi:hypothetical protein